MGTGLVHRTGVGQVGPRLVTGPEQLGRAGAGSRTRLAGTGSAGHPSRGISRSNLVGKH